MFLHIFAKNRKANLTTAELAEYSKAAHELAKLSKEQLLALVAKRGWRELEI